MMDSFVDIGGIVGYHCFNYLFLIYNFLVRKYQIP